MFDKTFIKFAIGFIAIITLGIGSLFLVGQYRTTLNENQSAGGR